MGWQPREVPSCVPHLSHPPRHTVAVAGGNHPSFYVRRHAGRKRLERAPKGHSKSGRKAVLSSGRRRAIVCAGDRRDSLSPAWKERTCVWFIFPPALSPGGARSSCLRCFPAALCCVVFSPVGFCVWLRLVLFPWLAACVGRWKGIYELIFFCVERGKAKSRRPLGSAGAFGDGQMELILKSRQPNSLHQLLGCFPMSHSVGSLSAAIPWGGIALD